MPGGVSLVCGPTERIGIGNKGSERFISLHDKQGEDGYDGIFYLGTISTSPPANGDEPTWVESETSKLKVRARRARRDKQFDACHQLYAQASQAPDSGDEGALDAGAGDALYNAACCAALSGQLDQAFETLGKAITHGFTNVAHISVDSDLATLHDDPRWPAILEQAQRKASPEPPAPLSSGS